MVRVKTDDNIENEAASLTITGGGTTQSAPASAHGRVIVTVPGSGGSGVPAGGTTGQVLDKLSNADGDAGWATPALQAITLPLAASGAGAIGGTGRWADAGHIHPAAASAAFLDAYPVLCGNPVTTGDIYTLGAFANSNFGMNGAGYSYPFRMQRAGTFKLGVKLNTAGGSGALIRIGVFNDDAGGIKPGTVFADLGTLDATQAANNDYYCPTAVALDNTSRYWVMVQEQGASGTHPVLQTALPPPFSVYNALDGSHNPATCLRYSISGAFADNPAVNLIVQNNPFLVYFKAQ